MPSAGAIILRSIQRLAAPLIVAFSPGHGFRGGDNMINADEECCNLHLRPIYSKSSPVLCSMDDLGRRRRAPAPPQRAQTYVCPCRPATQLRARSCGGIDARRLTMGLGERGAFVTPFWSERGSQWLSPRTGLPGTTGTRIHNRPYHCDWRWFRKRRVRRSSGDRQVRFAW